LYPVIAEERPRGGRDQVATSDPMSWRLISAGLEEMMQATTARVVFVERVAGHTRRTPHRGTERGAVARSVRLGSLRRAIVDRLAGRDQSREIRLVGVEGRGPGVRDGDAR
jgi:hypothetical protein